MDTPVGRAVLQQTGTRPQRLMFALQTLYEGLTSHGKPTMSFPRLDQGVLSARECPRAQDGPAQRRPGVFLVMAGAVPLRPG
jgi:hypothetical protein